MEMNTEVELKEESAQNQVQKLRDWLEPQLDFHIYTDDLMLLNFFRGCKFDYRRTKEKLCYMYGAKPTAPELFDNRDPMLPELQHVLKAGIITGIECPDSVLAVLRWKKVDPKYVTFQGIIKASLMMFDILLRDKHAWFTAGLYLINDFEGFPFKLIPQSSPFFLRKILHIVQKGYPLRIKGIHLLHVPAIVEASIKFLNPFLGKKLKERIVFHGAKFTDLPNYLPIACLPQEYGGEYQYTIDEIADQWKNRVEINRNWFLETNQFQSKH